MSFYKLILKSIWYFRKQHFAVFLGTLVSTAVLTGALIIGDSVRYSLRSLVEKRLGKTEMVLNTGGRFVRTALANELASKLEMPASPLLMLQGIAANTDINIKVNNAQIIGIDSSFNQFSPAPLPALKVEEALISENAARKLELKVGDEFLLQVRNADIIPLNTPLVPENNPSVSLRVSVRAVLADDQLGRFSLRNNQSSPFNIILSHSYLAKALDLSGLTNTILFAAKNGNIPDSSRIADVLQSSFRVKDAGIEINHLKEKGKYEIISSRIFIDDPVSKAVKSINVPYDKALVYLVNSINFKKNSTPYSFVAALSNSDSLKSNEIIVNKWLADDLGLNAGDSISLNYYVIGPLRTLKEDKRFFVVKKVIPTEGGISDSTLMPSFPGITEAGNCSDWNSGVPIDFKRIRDKDEKYWDDYRGTPKAFISIETGLSLWGNSFGKYTSFRFDNQHVASSDSLEKMLLSNLKVTDLGFALLSVRSEGINAADNAVDFGELFLSLSFFIILAGIIFTALVYVLSTEIRSRESAILAGLGFNKKQIIWFRFSESLLVIVLGGILGSLVGIAYNYGLVAGLNTIWHDAVREKMLIVYISPLTLITGAVSGIILALLTIWFVTRKKLKQPIANLIRNAPAEAKSIRSDNQRNRILILSGFAGAIILILISILTSSYENAALFLSAGALFLMGAVAFISHNINKPSSIEALSGSLTWLAIKNAGHNKKRSITIVLVLALGVFIIMLTGSYRKTYYGEENQRKSGSGGFTLWAETTMPVPFNLSTAEGQKNLAINNNEDIENVSFNQLYTLDGDDASCLNLSQVKTPRILGVNSADFDKKQAFSFTSLLDGISKEHPWPALVSEDGVIPAFADQTVITYSLKKKLGDTLTYLDETGNKLKIKLVGGLDNSVFQGSILISKDIFLKHFPSAGSKVMLIEAPESKQDMVAKLINNSFSDYGVVVEPTTERLARFNSVENTYLSVFMALGGLGFLIGVLGLGIILYRSMLERQHELALLKALGYKKNEIFRLILTEYSFLLLSGLLCGVIAAIIGVSPSLISPSFTIQGGFLTALMFVILITGLTMIYFLTKTAVNRNLKEALQEE
jgi:ABC-type lipoprotein release transport system permease subunit